MYLGVNKKRNGCYVMEFSKSPKKTWVEWFRLLEIESAYLSELKIAIKDAESAPNMPAKLDLLAKVNEVKSRIDNDKTISTCFRETAIDLF